MITERVVKKETELSKIKPKTKPQCLKLNGMPIKPAPTIEFNMFAIVFGNADFGVGRREGGRISNGKVDDDRSVVELVVGLVRVDVSFLYFAWISGKGSLFDDMLVVDVIL